MVYVVMMDIIGWLVVLGFNGHLRQYFSLYRAVSQRERERERERSLKEIISQTD